MLRVAAGTSRWCRRPGCRRLARRDSAARARPRVVAAGLHHAFAADHGPVDFQRHLPGPRFAGGKGIVGHVEGLGLLGQSAAPLANRPCRAPRGPATPAWLASALALASPAGSRCGSGAGCIGGSSGLGSTQAETRRRYAGRLGQRIRLGGQVVRRNAVGAAAAVASHLACLPSCGSAIGHGSTSVGRRVYGEAGCRPPASGGSDRCRPVRVRRPPLWRIFIRTECCTRRGRLLPGGQAASLSPRARAARASLQMHHGPRLAVVRHRPGRPMLTSAD